MAILDGLFPLLSLLGFAVVVLSAAMATSSIRSTRKLRLEMMTRHDELARHLRRIESRMDRIGGQARIPDAGETPVDKGGGSFPKAWRKEPAARVPSGPSQLESLTSPILIAVPVLAAPHSVPIEAAEEGLAERHREILTLAAAGRTPEEIARRTGQPIGQVELILGLHRQIHSFRGPVDHARAD
jgi:hypothetical protein